MLLFDKCQPMQAHAIALRTKGNLIGLISTQGNLHAGHEALIRAARDQVDEVVVSIFRNSLQYGTRERADFLPEDHAADLEICQRAGVNTVFLPSSVEFLDSSLSTYVSEENLSKGLCGISRPHYFRGALTAGVKLFHLVRPDMVFMGQCHAQLASVYRKMIRDFHFCLDIVTLPTVREADGLAVARRNQLLSPNQREAARQIPLALQAARELVASGNRNTDRVIAETTHVLTTNRRNRVLYVSIVHPETMEPERIITPGQSMLALAVWVDEVRLMDNCLL